MVGNLLPCERQVSASAAVHALGGGRSGSKPSERYDGKVVVMRPVRGGSANRKPSSMNGSPGSATAQKMDDGLWQGHRPTLQVRSDNLFAGGSQQGGFGSSGVGSQQQHLPAALCSLSQQQAGSCWAGAASTAGASTTGRCRSCRHGPANKAVAWPSNTRHATSALASRPVTRLIQPHPHKRSIRDGWESESIRVAGHNQAPGFQNHPECSANTGLTRAHRFSVALPAIGD